jgi:DNA-binding CsgD family transcriptional regulator
VFGLNELRSGERPLFGPKSSCSAATVQLLCNRQDFKVCQHYDSSFRGQLHVQAVLELTHLSLLGLHASVFRGEAVCPPVLCASVFQYVSQVAKSGPSQLLSRRPRLTLRQQQLVALVAKGLTNKEVASQLNLSEYIVKNHIHRIMKQLGAGSRREAVENTVSHGYSLCSQNESKTIVLDQVWDSHLCGPPSQS